MNIKRFPFNKFIENTMVVYGDAKGCVIVDPGCCLSGEQESLTKWIAAQGLVPEGILITHGHIDHVSGAAPLQRLYDIPVYMNPADEPNLAYNVEIAPTWEMPTPDNSFRYTPALDGGTIRLAGFEFKVITTPGHSPGSVCYYCEAESVLFSGDTLFRGTIGRSDLKFGDYDSEIRSIMEKLMGLPGGTGVWPGHGFSTTIAAEREHNPFLEPFNEPEEPIDPDSPGISIHGV